MHDAVKHLWEVIDGDMTVMIFPVTPDRDLHSAFGMFIFSEAYDPMACKTGKHVAIAIESLEDGQRLAQQTLLGGPFRSE